MQELDKDIKNFKKTRLVVAGDSWSYGSEIRDPKLPKSVHDWDPPNDEYRIPRIWPSKLANLMEISEVINLSYPAASNDRILRHLIGWLVQEHVSKGKSTEDLFVIVGLTSPERKDFYYKDKKTNFWFTLWPMWKHLYPQKPLNTFSEIYSKYLWNVEESTHRYLNQILYLQTFFELHKIKYLFFQAFYQRNDMHIQEWIDDPYHRHYNGQPDHLIWNLIDPLRFMHKDDEIHSFHNYIKSQDLDPNYSNVISGMHPSEYGHTLWAEHIYQYLQENNLC